MSAIPKLSERQAEIVETAVRDGVFVSASKQDTDKCRRLDGLGLLLRDLKEGARYYPTDVAKARVGVSDPADDQKATSDSLKLSTFRRKIETIDVGARLRPVDQVKVEALKVSISDLGLKTPITVYGTPLDARAKLSAGGHRLEAMRQLGETHIDCFYENGDELDAELWEIDENLARSELTPADRALFTHRRKEIYLIKHPDTAREATLRKGTSPFRQVGETGEVDRVKRFTSATAEATGQSERSVQRDAERGSKIDEMALHHIRGTRLNSGTFLDRLKHVPFDNQVLYVKAALADEKRKAAEVKENRQKLSQVRHAVRMTHMAHVANNGQVSAGQVGQKFPIIYADPPWRFGVFSEVTGRDKSPENHYPTMSTHDICGLFEKIGTPAKQDAILFLWATNPMLPDAFKVMEAWGFTYVHHWIWDKEVAGTGYWGRDRHELLLIGKRGKPLAPLPGTQPHTVHREQKGRHSAKPDFYANTIDRLYPGVPKLEMFSRSERAGWTSWGFEAAAEAQEAAE